MITMELQATAHEVMRAVEALQDFGRKEGILEPAVHRLAVALEECGSNIVNHALKCDPNQKFHVSFGRERNKFLIELRDPGPPFDPIAYEGGSALPSAEEDFSGGWGIQIVRGYTDAIRYRREGNENVLLLIKDLGDSQASDPDLTTTTEN